MLNIPGQMQDRVNSSVLAAAVPRQAIDMNTYRYVTISKNMYTQKGMIQII